MPKTIQELRAAFRKLSPELAGQDGESYADIWLRSNGWKYEPVEQGRTTLSNELKVFGGKRPDFLVDVQDEDGQLVVAIDAKFHSTKDCTIFCLLDAELEKYRRLQVFIEKHASPARAEVMFMVIPKERDGKRLVWVHLAEFERGRPSLLAGEPATQVSLEGRDELWFNIEA